MNTSARTDNMNTSARTDNMNTSARTDNMNTSPCTHVKIGRKSNYDMGITNLEISSENQGWGVGGAGDVIEAFKVLKAN